MIQGMTQDLQPKPDPAGLLAAVQACGAVPEHSLYVGDSGVDVLAARRAGLRAVGAGWGFRTTEELLDHGAEYVVTHPLGILEIADRVWKGGGGGVEG